MNVPKTMSALAVLFVVQPVSGADVTPQTILDNVAAKRAAFDTAKKAKDEAEQAARDYKADFDKKFSDAGLTGPPAPPPNPLDPLTIKLRDAYKIDVSPTKADDTKTLIVLMEQCAGLCTDATLLSVGDLAKKCNGAMKTLFGTKTSTLLSVLKAELAAAFPTDAPLTPELRTALAGTFTRFQVALTEAMK